MSGASVVRGTTNHFRALGGQKSAKGSPSTNSTSPLRIPCALNTLPRNSGGMRLHESVRNIFCPQIEEYILQHSVPVVLGGKSQRDYLKFLPPHSYINVEDFESPKDLAEYLKFLDEDAKEYNKYHQWRKDYTGRVSN